jgi:hypothetical protein
MIEAEADQLRTGDLQSIYESPSNQRPGLMKTHERPQLKKIITPYDSSQRLLVFWETIISPYIRLLCIKKLIHMRKTEEELNDFH